AAGRGARGGLRSRHSPGSTSGPPPAGLGHSAGRAPCSNLSLSWGASYRAAQRISTWGRRRTRTIPTAPPWRNLTRAATIPARGASAGAVGILRVKVHRQPAPGSYRATDTPDLPPVNG